MTEKEFFDKVKGKRIRWSTWIPGAYFIPKIFSCWAYKRMYGEYIYKSYNIQTNFRVENGFKYDSQSNRWELVDTEYIVME